MSLHLAYTAGLFDGEGCVTLVYTVCRRRVASTIPIYGFKFVVLITNTHRGVFRSLRQQFGGYIHLTTRSRPATVKPCWSWRLTSFEQQRRFLEAIQPYCIIKQRAVRLGLAYLQTAKKPGRRTPEVDWLTRVDICRQLQRVNQRGLHAPVRQAPTRPPEDWRPSKRHTPEELQKIMQRLRLRNPKGEARTSAKITAAQAQQIRQRYRGANAARRASPGSPNSMTALAEEFGVSQTLIHKILAGEAWASA